MGLAGIARTINSGYSEGSFKWRVLPHNRAMLAQAVGRVETSTGLTNLDGSVLPVMVFLEDHKADTLRRVVAAVKGFDEKHGTEKTRFRLAGGNAGVMAATNEVVDAAQFPILIYVYVAVALLCFASYRSIKAVVCIVLPLALVSVLAHSLMHALEIGLKTSTLPVVALGVGEGVDYGIYLFSCFVAQRRKGLSFAEAMDAAMTAGRQRGGVHRPDAFRRGRHVGILGAAVSGRHGHPADVHVFDEHGFRHPAAAGDRAAALPLIAASFVPRRISGSPPARFRLGWCAPSRTLPTACGCRRPGVVPSALWSLRTAEADRPCRA